MPRNTPDTVYIYRGPGHQVPWAEIGLRVGAKHGHNTVLELVITSKLVGEPAETSRSDHPSLGGASFRSAADTALQPSRQPTLYDVARVSGVCISTASRVVNNKTGVSLNTRMRVQEIIGLLGFKPNEAAQNMVRSKRRAPEAEGANCSSETPGEFRQMHGRAQEAGTERTIPAALLESE